MYFVSLLLLVLLSLLLLLLPFLLPQKPSVNDSVTPLAWGLAGGIVAVNIISAYIMWHGYTRYEEEATAKQDEKIQSKLARLQAQGELRSSLMDMDQPLSSGGSPAMGPGQYAYATGHYSLPPRQ